MRKNVKFLTGISFIIALAAFFLNVESMNAATLQDSHCSQNLKSANASVKVIKKHFITPNQARNFLNDLDMPTRPYVNTLGANSFGKYEADSDRFILETRSDRYQNNLSYVVFGDKFFAKAVELDLTVNDLSFSSNAIAELIKYSDSLIFKVTGEKLPQKIKNAMLKKAGGQWIVNGYKIKLDKEIFQYEKIIKGEEPTSDNGAFSLTFLIEL